MQDIVGGYIEAMSFVFDDAPTVYCNEEGKFMCTPNRAIYATEEMAKAGYLSPVNHDCRIRAGELFDIVYGDFFCVGFDEKTGEPRDITDEEFSRVVQQFGSSTSIASGMIETLCIKLGRKSDQTRS